MASLCCECQELWRHRLELSQKKIEVPLTLWVSDTGSAPWMPFRRMWWVGTELCSHWLLWIETLRGTHFPWIPVIVLEYALATIHIVQTIRRTSSSKGRLEPAWHESRKEGYSGGESGGSGSTGQETTKNEVQWHCAGADAQAQMWQWKPLYTPKRSFRQLRNTESRRKSSLRIAPHWLSNAEWVGSPENMYK